MYRIPHVRQLPHPKGMLLGSTPFKSPPTTNLEEQDITVKVDDYS